MKFWGGSPSKPPGFGLSAFQATVHGMTGASGKQAARNAEKRSIAGSGLIAHGLHSLGCRITRWRIPASFIFVLINIDTIWESRRNEAQVTGNL
jgi:hypothetical protein